MDEPPTPIVDPDAGAVFLLTDYGTADEFVGVVHAVLLREAPGVPIVDLSHELAPHDVAGGARLLARAAPHLGSGVVVGIVDPGVGGTRHAVALSLRCASGPYALVGPDNGLLLEAADVLGGIERAVALPAPPDDGPRTFDGRDVFAPVAAALWAGAALSDVGTAVDPAGLVRLPPPDIELSPGRLQAEVLWVDRFGNAQLAVDAVAAARSGLTLGDEAVLSWRRTGATGASPRLTVRPVRAFGELRRDEVGVLADANGRLAVVCNERSAATVLGLEVGDVVEIRWGT